MKRFLLILLLSSLIWGMTYNEFLALKPVQYGVLGNYHLPEHTAGIASIAWLSMKLNMDSEKVEKWSFIGMVGFEFYQLSANKFDPVILKDIYGSLERWAYDSAGDVIVPWVIMRMILYTEPWWKKRKPKSAPSTITYNPFIQQIQLTWSL